MGKHLQTKDIWEHFTMQFSIYYPESEGDQLYFKGSKKIRALSDSSMCISSSAEPDPHTMTKSKKDFEWIRVKYGYKVKPWQSPLLKVPIKDISLNQPIRYEYSLRNKDKNTWVKERHFNRNFEFGDPSKY